MKKQYLLLLTFALSTGLTRTLTAMEDPNGDKRRQKCTISDNEELNALSQSFGDLTILPNEIIEKIILMLEQDSAWETVADIVRTRRVNTSFNNLIKSILSNENLSHHLRARVKAELEEYKKNAPATSQLEGMTHVYQPNALHIAVCLQDQAFLNQYLPLLHCLAMHHIINQKTELSSHTPIDTTLGEIIRYQHSKSFNNAQVATALFDLFIKYGGIPTFFLADQLHQLLLRKKDNPRNQQTIKKLLSFFSCKDFMALDEIAQGYGTKVHDAYKAFIRQHHHCEKCSATDNE